MVHAELGIKNELQVSLMAALNIVPGYPSSYDAEEWKVTLVGEAYFSVKHDPAHPFIVSVSHDRLRVKVLGTEFNIRAYEKENVVQTTLVSGSVNIVVKEDKGKTNERNFKS